MTKYRGSHRAIRGIREVECAARQAQLHIVEQVERVPEWVVEESTYRSRPFSTFPPQPPSCQSSTPSYYAQATPTASLAMNVSHGEPYSGRHSRRGAKESGPIYKWRIEPQSVASGHVDHAQGKGFFKFGRTHTRAFGRLICYRLSSTQMPYAHAPSGLDDADQVSICSLVTSSNMTADNLTGAGRLLGRFYSFAGRHIETQLGRMAERLGFGPRVMAVRIQKRREAVTSAAMFANPWSVDDASITAFSMKIKSEMKRVEKESKKVEKDCKRILKYVKSNVVSTKKQALDHVTDLSIRDEYVHCLLQVLGAVHIIEQLQRYSTLWIDCDAWLLSSARKALVAVADVELHTLARKIEHCFDYALLPSLTESLTNHLSDPDRSFLAVRHIEHLLLHAKTDDIIYYLVNGLLALIQGDASSDSLEWEAWDRIFEALLQDDHALCSWGRSNTVQLSDVLEKTMRHADKLPRTVNSSEFQWFIDFNTMEVDPLHDDNGYAFSTYCLLEGIAKANGMELGDVYMSNTFCVDSTRLQGFYPHPVLQPLWCRLACPQDIIMCIIINERVERENFYPACANVVQPEDLMFLCQELVYYIDSKENLLHKRALLNIRKLLTIDTHCQAVVLQALSSRQFSSTYGHALIVEETKKACKPKELQDNMYETIYRHCNDKGSVEHLFKDPEWLTSRDCDCKTHEILIYSWDDVIFLPVLDGVAFSSAGYHPILAGHTADGKRAYIGYDLYNEEWFPAIEGTRPEDVHIQRKLPDGKQTTVTPEAFYVLILHYELAAYAQSTRYAKHFDDHKGKVDATGPYYWRTWKEECSNMEN